MLAVEKQSESAERLDSGMGIALHAASLWSLAGRGLHSRAGGQGPATRDAPRPMTDLPPEDVQSTHRLPALEPVPQRLRGLLIAGTGHW